jgi:hypothetical protein
VKKDPMTVRRFLTVLGACAAMSAAQAQTLERLRTEPTTANVGQPVKITLEFGDAATPNCNVRLHFGDGAHRDFKINQAKDVPLVASHSYAKPGSYTLKAEGKTALPLLKCVGANQTATLMVQPLAAAATATARPECPPGWRLDPKSVNRRSGAFACTAKPGTAAPSARLSCPSPLGYYENVARGQLGCRP